MMALIFVYIIGEVAHDHAQNAPLVKNWVMSCVQAAERLLVDISGDRQSWLLMFIYIYPQTLSDCLIFVFLSRLDTQAPQVREESCLTVTTTGSSHPIS